MSAEKPDGYVFGRPTDYRPEFCERVIDWGAQGKSRTWICSELGVVRQTVRTWEGLYPDFLAAMERAMVLSQRWWEDKGQENIQAERFQASMWSRSMAARFPDEWREKSEVDMSARIQVTEVKRTIVDSRDQDA